MKKSRLLGAVCGCMLTFIASSVSAAIIDTVQISSSGTVQGGGPLPGNLNRLFQIPAGAIVDGFTVTLLVTSAFNPKLELVQTFSPFRSGEVSLLGINNPVFLTSGSGTIYDAMLGLIDSSSTSFPEAIRVNFPNDGQTSIKFSEIQISATGELGAVPIPPALYLFGSGLLGLIGVARKKSS